MHQVKQFFELHCNLEIHQIHTQHQCHRLNKVACTTCLPLAIIKKKKKFLVDQDKILQWLMKTELVQFISKS